jgi:hypothetical protein
MSKQGGSSRSRSRRRHDRAARLIIERARIEADSGESPPLPAAVAPEMTCWFLLDRSAGVSFSEDFHYAALGRDGRAEGHRRRTDRARRHLVRSIAIANAAQVAAGQAISSSRWARGATDEAVPPSRRASTSVRHHLGAPRPVSDQGCASPGPR